MLSLFTCPLSGFRCQLALPEEVAARVGVLKLRTGLETVPQIRWEGLKGPQELRRALILEKLSLPAAIGRGVDLFFGTGVPLAHNCQAAKC